MAWATTGNVRDAVADHLSRDAAAVYPDPNALEPKWDRIIARCLARAITDLSNVLAGRSFTAAQIAQWDDALQYSLDQAYYYSMIEGGSPPDQSDTDVKRFDRVKAIEKAEDPFAIRIGGALVAPGNDGDSSSTIGGGSMTLDTGGVNYGSLFGLRTRRRDGYNQYGDEITDESW